jgi:hypothetical protein
VEHKHSFPSTQGCAEFHLARARLLIALLCEGQSLRGVHAEVMLRVIARELDTVATVLVGEASAREFTALTAASGRSAYPPLRRGRIHAH